MADRPGVLFRFELLDALEQLDRAGAGELFISALRYGRDGTVPAFDDPLLPVVWSFIKTAVDRDATAYDGKILQKKYAVYVRECKKTEKVPEDFDTWKSSADITRYQPISGDIHNQEHTQNHTQEHNQTQEQEHTQHISGVAAEPPAPARDSRNLIFLNDEQYDSLVNELGERETRRCIDYLSEYCSTHGKSYYDWPAMIRKAAREGWGKPATDPQQTEKQCRKEAEDRWHLGGTVL